MKFQYLEITWNRSKLEALSYLFVIAIGFVLPISTFLTNAFFIAAITLYFSAGNIKSKFNFIVHNKISALFLIFCGLFFIGLFYNTAPLIDGLKIFYKYIDKFFYGALLFPIFRDVKLRKYAINTFIATMLLVLFFSYLNHFHLIPFDFTTHPDEVFKNHIETNFLMAFTSYLVMQKISYSSSCAIKYLLIALLPLFIIYIFLDAGRSGYFVFICLLLLFLWQKFYWKGLLGAVVTATCLIVIAFLFSSTFQGRIKDIQNDIITYYPGTSTSIGARMDFVKKSIQLIKKHPYFGTGTGSFAYEYSKAEPSSTIENPHNEFLYIWVQFGAFGVALLLMLFGIQLYQGQNLPKELKELAQALVISFIIGCLANSWLRDTTQGHFYVYLSSLIFAALPSSELIGKKISS